MRPLLSILFCFLTLGLFAQHQAVSGKITDAQNRQPLAFVNIVVNDGQYGGMSDIDGKYLIDAQEPIRSLKFSCLDGHLTQLKCLGLKGDIHALVTSFQLHLQGFIPQT